MRHRETFGGNGYVHFIDCGDVLTVYTYVKLYQIVYFIYIQFILYQSDLNKVV